MIDEFDSSSSMLGGGLSSSHRLDLPFHATMRRHAEFRACVYTLRRLSKDMTDPTAKLITELTAPNYHIRARAASTLGELQAIQSIPALLEALGDFDPADESSRVNMCASDG